MMHKALTALLVLSPILGLFFLSFVFRCIDDMLYNRSRGLPLWTVREDNPWGGR